MNKLEIFKKNTEEIITEEELKQILRKKNPIVYCGYEPFGNLHLGHFVTITKLIELKKKGNEEEIKKEVENWEKTIKAIGLDAKIILGSSFQFTEEYQKDVMRLAQATTINRGLRSMQQIGRDLKNATISQLWYPLMQVADIKYLKADIALGGLEQRKVHMIGKDVAHILNYKFVALHTPLITSLKGPDQKMSKSIPGSGISITDDYEEIKRTIKNAYCPEKIRENNPILQIVRLIIFLWSFYFKKSY